MAEEESTGQNKLFVILAIALIGLLVLGLMGIGGVFVIRQNLQEQASLAQPTPTLLIRLPNPTATPAPVKAAPTNTPAPTPTNTPVLIPGDNAEAAAVGGGDVEKEGQPVDGPVIKAPTRAPAGNATTPSEVPNTGLGGLELILVAVGLTAVLLVARRMRTSS
jgi:hypothetical protein